MSPNRRDEDTANTITCLRAVRDVADRITNGDLSKAAIKKAYEMLEDCGKQPLIGGMYDIPEMALITWYTHPISSMLAKDLPQQEGKPWPEKTGRKPNSNG